MKKTIFKTLLFFLLLLATACNKQNEKITVIVPNGTPTMAFGKFLENADYEYCQIDVVLGADPLTAAFTSLSHDIIVAPINLGAKLYMNKNSEYKLYAILTSGNSYLITNKNNKLDSITDLLNKEILAYGQNNIPGIVLSYCLDKANVNANITYEPSIDAVTAKFLANLTNKDAKYEYVLTAEPSLSIIEEKYQEVKVLDLQKEFTKHTNFSIIPQAAIFINPNSKNLKQVLTFLKKLEDNVKYLNEKPKEYAEILANKTQFSNMGKTILEKSIPRSNIVFYQGKENKQIVDAYFAVLNEYNPNILGNKLPSEDFYYE